MCLVLSIRILNIYLPNSLPLLFISATINGSYYHTKYYYPLSITVIITHILLETITEYTFTQLTSPLLHQCNYQWSIHPSSKVLIFISFTTIGQIYREAHTSRFETLDDDSGSNDDDIVGVSWQYLSGRTQPIGWIGQMGHYS